MRPVLDSPRIVQHHPFPPPMPPPRRLASTAHPVSETQHPHAPQQHQHQAHPSDLPHPQLLPHPYQSYSSPHHPVHQSGETVSHQQYSLSQVQQLQHHRPTGRHTRIASASSAVGSGGGASAPEVVSATSVLPSFSKVDEATGRRYQLDVVQQPKRARMCGFGDKDRRPITPPPCVRLIIIDITTGKEVDCNDIDHTMFVLNVDLWNEDGSREVNLVRSSTSTHSTSSSSSSAFGYTPFSGREQPGPYSHHLAPTSQTPSYNHIPAAGYLQNYSSESGYSQTLPSYTPNSNYGAPQQYHPPHQAYRQDGQFAQQGAALEHPRGEYMTPGGYSFEQDSTPRASVVSSQPQGMFTRNLIGSLAASAFRLSDNDGRVGIWFVLQDLSVRTEGPFRLRFSFVNVASHGGVTREGNSSSVNTGRAPILASSFSEVFHVFSAKKFPGVCESTPLSKTFATQGIKIPIRKDTNSKGDDEDEYGD